MGKKSLNANKDEGLSSVIAQPFIIFESHRQNDGCLYQRSDKISWLISFHPISAVLKTIRVFLFQNLRNGTFRGFIAWACTAPQNNKKKPPLGEQKYIGAGGHLLAIAAEMSEKLGYLLHLYQMRRGGCRKRDYSAE